VQNFSLRTLDNITWKSKMDCEGSIQISIKNNTILVCRMNSEGLRLGFCEHVNEPLCSIKGAVFLNHLGDHKLLEKHSTT
jgi:hypothetical protein